MANKTRKIILPEYIPNTLCLYTDGSAITSRVDPMCYGGWGLYITNHIDEHIGYKDSGINTTVSRMEQEALDHALEFTINRIKSGEEKPIHIYSDSQFVVNSIHKGWLSNWVRERFIGRTNADIWKRIWGKLEILRKNKADYEIHHMNGHLEDLNHPHIFGNNMADLLADYKQHL